MCRFLLVKFTEPQKPADLLAKFANMAEASLTFDGDWQGDGWGISYLKPEVNNFETYKSVNPVWQERNKFSEFPGVKIFAVHARSATFKNESGTVAYSQPYGDEEYSFVFNGSLSGVKLQTKVPGLTGAEKIWNLIKVNLNKKQAPESAIEKTVKLLQKVSDKINALNVGLATKNHIIASCNFTPIKEMPEYYNLQVYESNDINFICSEPLAGFKAKSITSGVRVIL